MEKLGWPIDAATQQTLSNANGTQHAPLGKVFDLPIQFGKMVILITVMVVKVSTYHLLLGNDWLGKAGAIIDMAAQKMQINWKGRKMQIPINLSKGVLPELEEPEEKEPEFYVTQFEAQATQRGLTQHEQSEFFVRLMQDRKCELCGTRIYCAEHMCSCSATWKFDYGQRWQDAYPKQKFWSTYEPKEEKYFPPIWFGNEATGPWNNKNPHPLRNEFKTWESYGEKTDMWSIFWNQAKFIGKKHFLERRSKYDTDTPIFIEINAMLLMLQWLMLEAMSTGDTKTTGRRMRSGITIRKTTTS